MTAFAVACDADDHFDRQPKGRGKSLREAITPALRMGSYLAEICFSDSERQPEIEIVSGRLPSTRGLTKPHRLGSRRKSSASDVQLELATDACGYYGSIPFAFGAELFFLILPFFATGVSATKPLFGVVFLGGSFLSARFVCFSFNKFSPSTSPNLNPAPAQLNSATAIT